MKRFAEMDDDDVPRNFPTLQGPLQRHKRLLHHVVSTGTCACTFNNVQRTTTYDKVSNWRIKTLVRTHRARHEIVVGPIEE